MTCDRCTLTDDEAEAVRRWCDWSKADRESWVGGRNWEIVEAVLRRLLTDERVEHRCEVCGSFLTSQDGLDWHDHSDERVERAAHAGIGGTE